jgi:hypothetical protein
MGSSVRKKKGKEVCRVVSLFKQVVPILNCWPKFKFPVQKIWQLIMPVKSICTKILVSFNINVFDHFFERLKLFF